MLAKELVVRDNSEDSHWDDSACALLQGLLLHVAGLPQGERHMGTVRALLTQPEPKLLARLEELAGQKQGFEVVARAASTFLTKCDRERSGVLSTAIRHTAFLDDPRVVRMLQRNDVDFTRLKTELTTVYFVLPPDKLEAYNRLARATLGLAFKAMMRVRGKPRHDVLFLLDEFAQLGRFDEAEKKISILRGYGATLWILVQDLGQLQDNYRNWSTFLANTVLQAFGTQDQGTTRYISEALGNETIRIETTNESSSHNWQSGTSTSESKGQHYHGRPLLTPDEVRRLPHTEVIVLEPSKAPQRLRRLNYLTDPECAGHFEANPMHETLPRAG